VKRLTLNVRGKIITLFLITMVISIFVIGSVSAVSLSRNTNKDILGQLESISSVQKSRIEAILKYELERLSNISQKPKIQQTLDIYNNKKDDKSKEILLKALDDNKESMDNVLSIELLDKEGKYVVSTNRDHNDDSVQDKMLFEMAKTMPHIHFERGGSSSKLFIHGPVMYNKELVGVAIIRAGTDPIINVTKDYTGLGDTGETVLLNGLMMILHNFYTKEGLKILAQILLLG
jgi:hypothetical protein